MNWPLFDTLLFCRRYRNICVIYAILAPCLSNLPPLILSTETLVLVTSGGIRLSHFLSRRKLTLMTRQASATSSDSQQVRQDKQERTEHFIQITNQTLDGKDDRLCVWIVRSIYLQRTRSLFITHSSILGCSIYTSVRNLHFKSPMITYLVGYGFTKHEPPGNFEQKYFYFCMYQPWSLIYNSYTSWQWYFIFSD